MKSALVICALMHMTLSKLVVYGPQELIDKFDGKKAQINANYANFGHIPYGQSLIGSIYFDETNALGCGKIAPETLLDQTDDQEITEDTIPTKILILDRGECSFVQKVRNAERAGASLVVVVDNKVENVTNVIMGDDGTGVGIRIPSMLIGKTDGQILKDFAKEKQGATLSAEFTVKISDEKVNVEFWYSSNNKLALDFLKEFDKYAHQLEGYMDFTPRFVTWACPNCESTFIGEECLSEGKYCAPNHVRTQFMNVLGRDILKEDLRQSCLYESQAKKGQWSKWFDYIKEVHAECFDFISEKCSQNAHNALGLDWTGTKKCLNTSFIDGAKQSKSDNSIMKANADQWIEYGTLFWPAVTINKVTFRGDITPENVLEDVCANLKAKPQVCIDFYKEENIEYVAPAAPESKLSAELLVAIVVLLVVVNVFLICAYRRCVKKEMERDMGFKVSSAVSEYISLAQQNKNTAAGTSIEVE